LRLDVITIDVNYLLQSLDPALENTCGEVGCQIPQDFNDGSENILDLNDGSSREFTWESAKEEKVDYPGGRADDGLA
jgi:hypothetical protein